VHAVRRRILEILKEQGNATVAELARDLGMAPVSVRHHLDILQGDNLICIDRVRRKGRVGRPQQVYALTDEANALFPNDFANLAANLVQELKRILPPEEVERTFESIARNMAEEMPGHGQMGLSLEERLERITDYLNQRGYLARWEREDDDAQGEQSPVYLIHKHNCPYAGVSDKHPELCMMDQALIDELVGSHCERTQSMVGNQLCCTYRVAVVEPAEIVLAF
jgi:predicted ArsR family transcriptional regulator